MGKNHFKLPPGLPILLFSLESRVKPGQAVRWPWPQSTHTQASCYILRTSAAVYTEISSLESPKTKDKTANRNWTTVCTLSWTAGIPLLGGKVLLGFAQSISKCHGLGWKDEEEVGPVPQNRVSTRAGTKGSSSEPAAFFSLQFDTRQWGYVEKQRNLLSSAFLTREQMEFIKEPLLPQPHPLYSSEQQKGCRPLP